MTTGVRYVLSKGASLPVGHVSTYANGSRWHKTGPSKWTPLPSDKHPDDKGPLTAGPVHRTDSLAAVESKIRHEPLEHIVFFDAQGRQVGRQVGTASQVNVTQATMRMLRRRGDVVATHNHPSGGFLSSLDILAAVFANLAEMRAVRPDGFAWVLRRPLSGRWAGGGLSDYDVILGVEGAERRGLNAARQRYEPIIEGRGGQPWQGDRAVGYDASEWTQLLNEELLNAYTDFTTEHGLDWHIGLAPPNPRRPAQARPDPAGQRPRTPPIPERAATGGDAARGQVAFTLGEPTDGRAFWHKDAVAELRAARAGGLKVSVQLGTEFDRKMSALHGKGAARVNVTVPDESKVGAIRLLTRYGPNRGAYSEGGFAIIHRSSKPEGGWQASYFDKDGDPFGDSPRKTLQAALDIAREEYYVTEVVSAEVLKSMAHRALAVASRLRKG